MQLNVTDSEGVRRCLAVRLGTINRWLRWTGFVVTVVLNEEDTGADDDWTTAIGVYWRGWP